jgi:hypothetical protein
MTPALRRLSISSAACAEVVTCATSCPLWHGAWPEPRMRMAMAARCEGAGPRGCRCSYDVVRD